MPQDDTSRFTDLIGPGVAVLLSGSVIEASQCRPVEFFLARSVQSAQLLKTYILIRRPVSRGEEGRVDVRIVSFRMEHWYGRGELFLYLQYRSPRISV